ncbi:MAG TPA: DUF6491 family protein [Micropepsaceae bacterium]|nr:DUF6491 family protein [Micropepsaceae bacterium]
MRNTTKRNTVIGIATAASALFGWLAMPHEAAAQPRQNICLQNNHIWGWNAVNDRMLIVTDRNYRRYVVRLGGGCIGLSSYPLVGLRFHTWTDLGCLQRGDMVSYHAPDLGALNCFVQEVQPYSPAIPAQAQGDRIHSGLEANPEP